MQVSFTFAQETYLRRLLALALMVDVALEARQSETLSPREREAMPEALLA